eukprot:307490-Alexandrium_andersonii.AAC.1
MLRHGAPWAGGSTDGRLRSRLPPTAVGDLAPELDLPPRGHLSRGTSSTPCSPRSSSRVRRLPRSRLAA